MDNAPEFLSKNFLETAVMKRVDSTATILSVTKHRFPVGDNFNSEMMRIKITFYTSKSDEIQELAIIAKYLPDDAVMVKYANDMNNFEREMMMYETTLPKMYNFGYLKTIAPKVYLIERKPKPTILLEDLSLLDYQMQPGRKCSDLEHSLYVINKLACFHAISVALYEKDPSSMKIYNQSIFSDVELMNYILTSGFQELVDTCKRRPELSKYVKKLLSVQKDFLQRLAAANAPSSKFNVLNYGDLWNNNILFSYTSDKQIKDVVFVDFQLSHFTSPAIDLLYFFVAGMDLIAKRSFTVLLRCYFEKLIYYLEILDTRTTPPTWEQFFEDLRCRSCYGIGTVVLTLAFMKAEKRPDATILGYINSKEKDDFRYHAYNNEFYVKDLAAVLSIYDDLGFFFD